jgi:hypothetical protein
VLGDPLQQTAGKMERDGHLRELVKFVEEGLIRDAHRLLEDVIEVAYGLVIVEHKGEVYGSHEKQPLISNRD